MPVQLQAFLVGKTPQSLSSDLENTGRRFQSRVVHALSAFLYETTQLKHWPWSKCDQTLADAGYELKLLPGARTLPETLKTSSNSLNQAKLVALEKDLKEHLIQLVSISRPQQTQLTNGPQVTQFTNNQTQPDVTQLNISANRVNGTQSDLSGDTLNLGLFDFSRINTNIIEPRTLDPSLM
ncbi:hypothetical protein DFH28DRAFT_1017572 [Melampsora americana]|nr:hypothetical protein DFH28DRAFT_1017572 [Melampsora americana]